MWRTERCSKSSVDKRTCGSLVFFQTLVDTRYEYQPFFGINMYYQKHTTSSFMFNTNKKQRLRQSGLLCITKLPVPMYGTCEGRVAETDNTYGNWSSAWYSHCKNIGLIQCCCLTIPSNYSYYCYKLNSQPKLPSGYLT